MSGHLRANGVDVDARGRDHLGPWLQLDPSAESFVDNDPANELRSRLKQREAIRHPGY